MLTLHPLSVLLCLGALALMSCGEDDGTGGNNTAPVPGVSAQGWTSSFQDGSARLSCEQSAAEMAETEAARLTVDETTVFVGYEQIGDNQNPIVARFDGDRRVYCVTHETEGPDGRALGITWNGGDVAYAVYTIVGGGSSLEGQGGWLSSYAPGAISGGGPKVSYIGRVNIESGELNAGTFVIAVKSDNKVNSHAPSGAVTVLEDGNVEFLGSSAHKPIDINGRQSMDCTDYPFESKYIFPPSLSTPVCAQCTNCISETPCD